MSERELLVNLRNGQRGEVPLSENAAAVRADAGGFLAEQEREADKKRKALLRLKIRAATGDEVLADLLTVLGLV